MAECQHFILPSSCIHNHFFCFFVVIFLNFIKTDKSYANDVLYTLKLVSINPRCCILWNTRVLRTYFRISEQGYSNPAPECRNPAGFQQEVAYRRSERGEVLSPMKDLITGAGNPAGSPLWGTGFGHPLSKKIEIRQNSWTPSSVMVSGDKGSGTCCCCWRPSHQKVSSSPQVNQWLMLPRGLSLAS